jgi:hypothetical protein
VTNADRLALARARVQHLTVGLSATAAGVFEPTEPLLGSLAELACSVAFDLAVAA